MKPVFLALAPIGAISIGATALASTAHIQALSSPLPMLTMFQQSSLIAISTRIESWAREAMNAEKVLTIGIKSPTVAMPAAMPSMFISAIPVW